YDWIVLTSVNGVAAVAKGLTGVAGSRVAAVGPVTAAAIQELGIEPAFVAKRASDDIAEGLGDITGKRVLLPQADIAEPHLAEELRGRGADVESVIAYRTILGEPAMSGVLPPPPAPRGAPRTRRGRRARNRLSDAPRRAADVGDPAATDRQRGGAGERLCV